MYSKLDENASLSILRPAVLISSGPITGFKRKVDMESTNRDKGSGV